MVTTLKDVLVLLPILIIGITIVVVLLSITCARNHFLHAGLTVIGLISAVISIGMIWCDQNVYNIFELICIDNISMLYAILILISSALSGILAYKWLLRYQNNRSDEFYLLLLISSIGGVLLTIANHLIILFVGIELLSLPLFGLIGYSFFKKYSLEASIKYIVLSGVSSSFLLLGMALIYADTGCLSFVDINQLLLKTQDIWSYRPMLFIGFSMMMVGFGFKLSFVPFHLWTLDVYQGSSYPVSMYLSNSSKIAVISALLRFIIIFPKQYNEIFYVFLLGIACCSIFVGNLMAIQQDSMKRILACSSIIHTGYLFIGVIVLKKDPIVLESIGIYLISYLIANVGMFAVIGIMSNDNYIINEDADSLLLYRGLFWKKPILSIVFTIVLLSLSGIPMTLGFVGKFYLFMLGVSNKLWLLVIFMGVGSIIAIFYYLRIMINLYVRPLGNMRLHSTVVADWIFTCEGIIVIICTLLILCLGLYPQPMIYYMNSFL